MKKKLIGTVTSVILHGCQKLSYEKFRKKEEKYNVKMCCSSAIILINLI